jgi:pyruvate/2-oxoacid:ferredoxin oxidoreductase alpha subunit
LKESAHVLQWRSYAGEPAVYGASFAGGVSVSAGYPITPLTNLVNTITKYAPQLRLDPETGAPTDVAV